jgi:acetoin utilization deacetylase AcuC-like enzyme
MAAAAAAASTAIMAARAAAVHLYHNASVMTRHVPPSREFMERPARIRAVEAALKKAGLWAACKTVKVTEGLPRSAFVAAYGAEAVASWDAGVAAAAAAGHPVVDDECGDIYWSADSLSAVSVAAAASVDAVKAVLRGETDAAFALVRPPGHHCFDMPAGFCTVNNVALAAQAALDAGKRVAIIDWDYHFGDGTAATFLDNPNVLFTSLHCFEARATGWESYPVAHPLKDDRLASKTKGRSFNIMWGRDDADDAAAAYAFAACILPAIRRFGADLVLVSAGYDALKGDALAGMEMTPAVFRTLAASLKTLGVPVVYVLEGGYDTALLSAGVVETVAGMMEAPSTAALDATAKGVKAVHKREVDRVARLIGL